MTYCSSKHNISPNQFTEYLTTLSNNCIVDGDFNAKHILWGCRVSHPRGNSLLRSIPHSSISIMSPSNYTYWPTFRHKNPDILDIFIAKIPNSLQTQTINLLEPCSNHSPVLLTIDCHPLDKPNSTALSCH